jgi:hypothetical protein
MIFRFFDETGLIGTEVVRPQTSDSAKRVMAQCKYCICRGRVGVGHTSDGTLGVTIHDGTFQLLDPTHPCQWWRKTLDVVTDSRVFKSAFNWTPTDNALAYAGETPVGSAWYDREQWGEYEFYTTLDMVFLPKKLLRLDSSDVLLRSPDNLPPSRLLSGHLDVNQRQW